MPSRGGISWFVWGAPTTTTTAAAHVDRIRTEVGDQSLHGDVIGTVRGIGYGLAPTPVAPRPSATSRALRRQ